MPIYRFHVAEKPPLWKSLFAGWGSRDPGCLPFIGTVYEDSFRVRRDIRYRNSFLPMVWGRLESIPSGTRVFVTMFIHPLVALFMVFWLGMVAHWASRSSPGSFIVWGMFAFGIVLTAAGFFPEAIKAKNLITKAVQDDSNPIAAKSHN
jgi:hypothetical protein